MTRDLEDVLIAIDGALADGELPDAMRWSPDPGSVTDASEPIYTEEQPLPPVLDALRSLDRVQDRMRADRQREHAARVRARRHPARGEVVQRDGWRMVDNRYPPEPITPERIASAFGTPPRNPDRERADLARAFEARIRARRHPVRTVHEDDGSLTLTVEPDMDALRETFYEAFRLAGERLTMLLEDLRPILDRHPTDEGPDPSEQPFERAMWARARQGTGPDRQVQHRPRPRRHLL